VARPNRGAPVQEADLRYGGTYLIVSETALTSQGSLLRNVPFLLPDHPIVAIILSSHSGSSIAGL